VRVQRVQRVHRVQRGWWAPLKIKGRLLLSNHTTDLKVEGKEAPFGGWRHHLPPASGGTTTRAYFRAAYEWNAIRSFIVPPLLRGKGGAVGTKGGKATGGG